MLIEAKAVPMASALTYPELAGKRILLTGAGQGEGFPGGPAIVEAFAGHGGRLILQLGQEAPHQSKLAERVRAKAQALRVLSADFSNAQGIDRFADAALRAYAGIDIVINIVRLPDSLAAARSERTFSKVIARAFAMPRQLSARVGERMRAAGVPGVIVNVLAEPEFTGSRALAVHAIAKTALEELTQSEAQLGFPYGLRCYGLMQAAAGDGRGHGDRAGKPRNTPLSDDDGVEFDDFFYADADHDEDLIAQPEMSGDPLDRIDDTCLFLASDKGRWMNGAVLTLAR